METDKVHPALQSLEHPYEGIRMDLGVVESGEHRVLEADTALTGEIILLYKVYHLL